MFKQLHINITLFDALILMPKYQKMLKALLSNKEKLQELAITPLNENCLVVILKKLPEKLGDLGKFIIPCGFSELKCKALADLGDSINLMPLSVWKKLGLLELISTRMTLKLSNRAICTPAGIARDVFVSVGKFTFPADFVIVDYESDPRVPLILGRPFLRTARALIGVHEGGNVLPEKLLELAYTKDLHPPLHVNPLSGSTTYSSSLLLEELAAELALITFPLKYDDDLQFDAESDLKEIEFLLHQDIDSSLNDLIDQKVESDTKNVYDDPFDSKGKKIKESKLLIGELDLPRDFLLPSEYDSFNSEEFSRVDAKPSTNNEDKVFNPGILSQENPFEIITRAVQDKKLAISNASLVLEDFDHPLYEPLFFKEVHRSNMLLPFSSENEETVFKPGIHTSKKFILLYSRKFEDSCRRILSSSLHFLSFIRESCKDCAQNVKNQSKTGQYQHKIGSHQQRPDQQAIFSRNQTMKPQKSNIQSLGSILAYCSKSKSRKKKQNQKIKDQICHYLRYPEIHPPSNEISDEVFQAKGDLMKSIQTFLKKFNNIPFGEKPKNLFQAWDNFFTIQRAQPEDSYELFQKLLEVLKELAEYKESLENSSKEIATSNSNEEKEEPPQDFDIQLVEIYRQKELLCMHDNVNDLIESALNTKLLLINSQHLDNKEQEVKNVVEQPAERGNHEIIKSGVEELVPILSENEVTSEDKRECDVLACEDSSTSEDIEYVEASLPDPEIVSVEEENVVQQEEEEVDLEDISQIQDIDLREKLLSITRLISNIESLNDNLTPDLARLINAAKSDIYDDSSNEPLLEEADLFLAFDNSIPPDIENFGDNSEGDIRFLKELLIDDSILSHESSDSNFEDNPSIPRPPPEPPDAETDAGDEILVVMNDELECLNPRDKLDDDYFSFMIAKMFLSFLSAESEDTIFDPGISA
nr:reverse transcriptase domain-containing protein [Tanacetum cinerariifolium]